MGDFTERETIRIYQFYFNIQKKENCKSKNKWLGMVQVLGNFKERETI